MEKDIQYYIGTFDTTFIILLSGVGGIKTHILKGKRRTTLVKKDGVSIWYFWITE